MNICGTEDNTNFDIIAANVESTETNQQSIVLKIKAVGRSILLSGDIEGDAAETVAQDSKVRKQLKSNVYQISHHGACDKANKCSWLKAIQPQEAFISHVYNSKGKYGFGHPRCVAISRLLSLGTIATGNLIHPFMCGKKGKLIDGDTCHHNKICAVRFTIGNLKSPATSHECFETTNRPIVLQLFTKKCGRSPSTQPEADARPKKKNRTEY